MTAIPPPLPQGGGTRSGPEFAAETGQEDNAGLSKSRFWVIRVPSFRNASTSTGCAASLRLDPCCSSVQQIDVPRQLHIVRDVGLDDLARDRQRRLFRVVVDVAVAGRSSLRIPRRAAVANSSA